MKKVLAVVLALFASMQMVMAEPTITSDKYERLVIKTEHFSRISLGTSEDEEKTRFALFPDDNRYVVKDLNPGKTYFYKIYDTKTKETFVGSTKVERKFPIIKKKKNVYKYIERCIKRRKPVIGFYTTLSSRKAKKIAEDFGYGPYYGTLHSGIFINGGSKRRYGLREKVTVNGKKYNYVCLYEHEYELGKKRLKKYMSRINKLAKVKGSRRLKVCKIDKWFSKHCKYNTSHNDSYNAVINKKSMCQGYTDAMNAICYKADIPCEEVVWKNHAWNIVKIGKKWYHVDVTWDVCCGYGKYLLKGCNDKKFNREHKITRSFYKRNKSKKYFSKHNLRRG